MLSNDLLSNWNLSDQFGWLLVYHLLGALSRDSDLSNNLLGTLGWHGNFGDLGYNLLGAFGWDSNLSNLSDLGYSLLSALGCHGNFGNLSYNLLSALGWYSYLGDHLSNWRLRNQNLLLYDV